MERTSDHEALFDTWLKSYGAMITKVTRSFARTEREVVELQQEIQLQLWTSLPSFERKSKESTWIYRVCLNTALSWRRSSNQRAGRLDAAADLDTIAGSAPSPAERAGQHDILGRVYAAIHTIPDYERASVLLMLDGLSYREIAEVTGLTEGHVSVTLTRARKRLATLLKGVIDELD
jgi:RNA polymerase sigma-70 factor (ECF subfamily)